MEEINRIISYSKHYHQITKHSQISVHLNRHYLDWENKPFQFKFYKNLPSISLPIVFDIPEKNALENIALTTPKNPSNLLDLKILSQILFFSGGITRILKIDSSKIYMRAASATGALYPIEIYLACKNIKGLESGIYHFCPGTFSLAKLVDGDFSYDLFLATGGNNNVLNASVNIIFTSIAWKNSWKYQTRSYRHWFWDCGVILSNYLALCNSNNLFTEIVLGFQDDVINGILNLNKNQEEVLVISPLGINDTVDKHTNNLRKNVKKSIIKNNLNPDNTNNIFPLSRYNEVAYPEIWKMHKASYLMNSNEIKIWLNELKNKKENLSCTNIDLNKIKNTKYHNNKLSDVILKRGSTRKFSAKSITLSQLENILYVSSRGTKYDFLPVGDSIIDIYFIANYVDGLDDGSYYYNRKTNSLQQLQSGNFKHMSSYLCLDQKLFANASVVFFLMSDLHNLLDSIGNRGYRVFQLEGGIIAGKIYLSSYANGIGASGSTFYDDEVTKFFSPHAKSKSTSIAIGIGVSSYISKAGQIYAGKLNKEDLLRI